jgi:hypothetical protein
LARRRRSAACARSESRPTRVSPVSASSRALYAAIHKLAAHAILPRHTTRPGRHRRAPSPPRPYHQPTGDRTPSRPVAAGTVRRRVRRPDGPNTTPATSPADRPTAQVRTLPQGRPRGCASACDQHRDRHGVLAAAGTAAALWFSANRRDLEGGLLGDCRCQPCSYPGRAAPATRKVQPPREFRRSIEARAPTTRTRR